jgi:hypothetical protein
MSFVSSSVHIQDVWIYFVVPAECMIDLERCRKEFSAGIMNWHKFSWAIIIQKLGCLVFWRLCHLKLEWECWLCLICTHIILVHNCTTHHISAW